MNQVARSETFTDETEERKATKRYMNSSRCLHPVFEMMSVTEIWNTGVIFVSH